MEEQDKEEKMTEALHSTIKRRDVFIIFGIIINILLFISVVFGIDLSFKLGGVEISKMDDHTVTVCFLAILYLFAGSISCLYSFQAMKIRNKIKDKDRIEIASFYPNILYSYPTSLILVLFLLTFSSGTLFNVFFRFSIPFSLLFGVLLSVPYVFVILYSRKMFQEVKS